MKHKAKKITEAEFTEKLLKAIQDYHVPEYNSSVPLDQMANFFYGGVLRPNTGVYASHDLISVEPETEDEKLILGLHTAASGVIFFGYKTHDYIYGQNKSTVPLYHVIYLSARKFGRYFPKGNVYNTKSNCAYGWYPEEDLTLGYDPNNVTKPLCNIPAMIADIEANIHLR